MVHSHPFHNFVATLILLGKMKKFLSIILLTTLVACSNGSKQSIESDLPVIDLEKEYPVKRIDIHEIADVEYIPLETTDESLLMSGTEKSISDKYIIVSDTGNGTFRFLIFDRQGKYIRTIDRLGQGPGEYISFHAFDVDFEKEEIYAYSLLQYKMWVYSFDGKFLREFKYDKNIKRLDLKRIDNYNQEYLLTYNDVYWPSPFPEYRRGADKTPYYLINKQTGGVKIADKQLVISNPVPPYLDHMTKGPSGYDNWTVGYTLNFVVRNGTSEFLLVDNSLDTLYTFNNHVLKPAIIRTPHTASMKTKRFISPCCLTDKYFIYRRVILENDLDKQEDIFYDEREFPAYIMYRETGEIFRLELYDSNFSMEKRLDNKAFTAFPGNGLFFSSTEKNQMSGHYNASYLLENLETNTYKGKLKEVVSKMVEDDNPLTVIYTFK